MDKYILCLANSYKHGGRCIAGIEVEINNGNLNIKRENYGLPIWVRPISHSFAGEVPMSQATGVDVLSVVKVHDAVYAGNGAHSEDHYYSRLEVIQKLNPSDQFLRQYIDSWHTNIFGNRGKALTPDAFQAGNYSLMLIRAEGAEVYLEERYQKQRIKFAFGGNLYDFPITDPVFLDRLHRDSSLFRMYNYLYIVASIAVEHEGWHSKLAATIIIPATTDIIERITPRTSPRVTLSHNSYTPSRPSVSSRITNSSYSQQSRPSVTRSSQSISTPRTLSTYSQRQSYRAPKNSYTNNSSSSNSGGCYVATTVYGSYDCPEVWTLRRYRDYTLAESWEGRFFIKTYYAISPTLVYWFGKAKLFKLLIKPILNRMVSNLQAKGVESTKYEDLSW